MAEFGNQIDVEYEIWQEHEGKFAQVACDSWDYDPMPLEEAERYLRKIEDHPLPGYRTFIVEVVSVRTEYGRE